MATTVLAQARVRVPASLYTGAILVAALILRLAATILAFRRCPPAVQVHANSEMLAVARSLAQGHGFSSPFAVASGPTAFLSPGYPLLLAGFLRLFGVSAVALVCIVALQILFSVLTVWLVMRLAQSCFGEPTAKIAGCICAFSLPLATEPFWVWETCLSSLLLVALFATLLRVRTHRQWAAAGAGSAVAALVNPALLPTLAALALWRCHRSRIIPWIAIFVFFLVYAPWPMRNLLTMHAFIPLRSNFGYELWMGNHPGGDGNFDHRRDPEESPEDRATFVSLGERGYMRMKTHAAVDFIRTHPGTFLMLTVRRVGRFWGSEDEGVSLLTMVFSLLACAGLAMAWRRRASLVVYAIPLAIYPLPYYITHADPRFRHVIDPLLAILAAYAIATLATILHARLAGRSRAESAVHASVA